MQLAVAGIGGAGARVAAALQRDSIDRHSSYVTGVAALDTDTEALEQLQAIPSDHRHTFGVDETNGTGTAGDRTAGIAAAETNRISIRRVIDPLITSTVDAILLVAGLAGGTGSGATPHIAQSLAGFVTLGYAARDPSPSNPEPSRSLTTRIRELLGGSEDTDVDELTAINTIETTVREATRGRLTVNCERNSTDQGLVVFTGPPHWLHRDAIATQRAWLQDELACQQIRSGDAPRQERTEIAVVVVLSGVDEVPRLTELQSVAKGE